MMADVGVCGDEQNSVCGDDYNSNSRNKLQKIAQQNGISPTQHIRFAESPNSSMSQFTAVLSDLTGRSWVGCGKSKNSAAIGAYVSFLEHQGVNTSKWRLVDAPKVSKQQQLCTHSPTSCFFRREKLELGIDCDFAYEKTSSFSP